MATLVLTVIGNDTSGLVDALADNVTALQAHLDGLNALGLLDLQVAIASSSTKNVPTENVLRLELELETFTLSAPMSGEPLFEAKATLRVPNELPLDQLCETLQDIDPELMVDLDLRPE